MQKKRLNNFEAETVVLHNLHQLPHKNVGFLGYRMMEKAGLPATVEWFRDDRLLPDKQAEYLKKLTKLREQLINQEQQNLIHTLQVTDFVHTVIMMSNAQNVQNVVTLSGDGIKCLRCWNF